MTFPIRRSHVDRSCNAAFPVHGPAGGDARRGHKKLVVVGKVFYTPDWYELQESVRFNDLDTTPAPTLTILRASKAIQEEAEDVYLLQNTFVLPSGWRDMQPFQECEEPKNRATRKSWLFSSEAFAKLRHVSIAFCVRSEDIPLVMSNCSWAEQGVVTFGKVKTVNEAHAWAHHFMSNSRRIMRNHLTEFKALQSLGIDFTNAYCPFGSCRFLETRWDFPLKPVEKVRLVGLQSGEKEFILDDLVKQTVKTGTVLGDYQLDFELASS